ncbi:MAG: NADH-quinone oxidoreductase subunit H [Candidatus Margulisbacteria bacterium]|nr:NADH-quinone oxidoreductase subunit H [Candidatus Margulisiibacteriota bacterium]
MDTVKLIIEFVIFPGFLFSALVGLLSTWVDRKVTARVQYRQGPPWFQPFADILKLLGKEIFVPEGASQFMFFSAPLIGLASVTLVSTMLWIFNADRNVSFIGDLIVVLYFLTVPSLALILAGSATRNPMGALGSSREMKMVLGYELPFLIAVFSVVARTGTILFGNIINYQAIHGPLIMSLSGLLAFAVVLLVVQAKLGYAPFDIAEAEQELMCGPLVEYSGAPLAIFRLTKAILFFVLPVFLITLFLGGIEMNWPGLAWFAVKYVIILSLIIVIKNTNPRLRIDQAVRVFWGPVLALSVVAFILALAGL